MPYAAAYARWRLAEALLAEGGARADAQSALAAAHAVAVRLRARPLAAELEALARRARLSLEDGAEPAVSDGDGAAERVGLTRASWRSCASWPRARPIARSARPSTSARRPSACTSRGSWPSSMRAAASRRPGLALRLGLLDEEEAEAVPDG